MAPPRRFAAAGKFSCSLQGSHRLHSGEPLPTTREMRLRPLTDPEEIALRARDVLIGGVLGVGTAIAVVAYLLQSPAAGHRDVMIAISLGWLVFGCATFLISGERLATSRWREPLFLLWSVAVIACIAAGIVLEGRPGTPLTAAFILPLIFAAISYPVVGTAIVGSLVLIAATVSSILVGNSVADMTFELMALAFAATMGVWQAHGRERRSAQLALEHRRAERYLDVAGTLIVVLNADGTIDTVNRKTCEVLGYGEHELLGRDWFELVVPEEIRPRAWDVFRHTLSRTPVENPERVTPLHTRDGELRWMAWTGRVIQTHRGDVLLTAGEDVTEQRAAQERVQHMAYHDALTGLANRAKLEEHAALALARARRHGTAGAILYIDLDRFKLVNDTLGHASGDELLRLVTTRLAARTRATDLLARHGGDEFMLLLADLADDAHATAERVAHDLLSALETPFVIEGHEFEIAASIGVAMFPADGTELSDVLKRADSALYQAKRSGRGTIRFAAGERVPATGRLTLTARMRRALARDEFELHYQPVWGRGERRGRGRGGAAALERPRAGDDPARRLHPGRRGQRPDRAARRLGRGRRGRPGTGLARAGLGARHRVQRLTPPAALGRLRRAPARPSGGRRRGPVHRGDHRVGGDGRP
jgi:diguanylate cyclase (GGDEF)-like protein/PAS domain S-box-containing protein